MLRNKHKAGVPYPLTLGFGMYAFPPDECEEYSEKKLVEYNLNLHTDRGRIDPKGELKKWIGREYSHQPHIEEFWVNCKDDKEVQMHHYMRMTLTFMK